jgi:hypothetical protein
VFLFKHSLRSVDVLWVTGPHPKTRGTSANIFVV